MATIRNNTQIATGNEGLKCFVCDVLVVGSYYTLASCRTQKTKVRLIEKLGQLVGDQYMVVISEDDVICRACTSMMNNLDRLEREMFSVRTIVLRFLEKKYQLEEGELVNTKISLPPQKFTNISNLKKNCMADVYSRKRKAAAMETDEVELVNDTENNKDTKTNTWLQCDKCKYRTPYSSFMVNHIQRHSPQNSPTVANEKEKLNDVLNEPPPVPKPVNPEPVVTETQEQVEPPNKDEIINNLSTIPETEEPVAVPETVEMIAAEINDLGVKEGVSDVVEKTMPIMNLVQEVVSPKQEFLDHQQSNLTLEVDGEEGVLDTTNAICMVDENGMILQKMEQAEDGTYYMHVIEGDTAKQVLSVNEDGTIQMVEVLWDGIDAQTVNDDDNMPF